MSRHPDRRDRARHLHHEQPPAEALLWRELRGRRLAGFKFRRQHSIGPYFADKVCVECKLIIELDGEAHLGREQHDGRRIAYLQEQGWFVLRFWNTDVYEDREAVLQAI